MKKTSIYDYYSFGFNYNNLKRGLPGQSQKAATESINRYLETLESLDLRVSLNAAQIVKKISGKLDAKSSDILTAQQIKDISQAVSGVDVTLDSELQLRHAYIITPKRFEIRALLDDPSSLLAKDVFGKISITAQCDFKSACKLIAFNSPTGSAFHQMRCVEDSVKKLYLTYKKTKRLEKPMWGPMVEELRKKKNPRPDAVLLEHIDQMRKNYRNPTQHPDKFYTIDEAQDLLNSSVVALNMIVKSIDSKSV